MSVRTVVVCEAQVPFVEGGAEYHVRALVAQLRRHGYDTALVSIPFKWYPKNEILAHAAAWRLLDLSEANGRTIDLAIGSKFPSYFVRHPNKVTWLIHQYRAAYELCGTPYSDFDHVEADVGLRAKLMELDRRMLGECQRLFTNARNTALRLHRYNGLEAQPLYHPPRLADRLHDGPYGDYVLSVGRIESVKRVDLFVRAMRWVDEPVRLIVVGDGTQRENVKRLADTCGVENRIQFLGTVDDETLLDLYAGALAVAYAPFDEDYGYVTLESFLARKPVITAPDSGGTLEFVVDDVTGTVCDPEPEQLASAVNRLAADRARAAALGDAGFAKASTVTWDGVVEQLVETPGA
jgi:glycosyltransferase involved in cell wall biosynthesis